jgi:hypothetical protein
MMQYRSHHTSVCVGSGFHLNPVIVIKFLYNGMRVCAFSVAAVAGSIFSVLLLLAVLTTKPYNWSKTGPFGFKHTSRSNQTISSSTSQQTDGLHGLWGEGGHSNFADVAAQGLELPGSVSCKGSSLRCDVVNRMPIPEVGQTLLSTCNSCTPLVMVRMPLQGI